MLRPLVRWLQGLLGPINRLPSWLNELLSGFLTLAVALGLLLLVKSRLHVDLGPAAIPLALILSELYERFLDPWGYNALDVAQRAIGIALGAVIWFVAYCYLIFTPLPSHPDRCFAALPDYPFLTCHAPEEHWAIQLIDRRSGATQSRSDLPAATSRGTSQSPLPPQSPIGVPLARV